MHLEHPPPCPPACGHCLAFDNVARALCSRTPSANSKWCEIHEELQAKLLKSYKRLTFAYEAFDGSTLPADFDAIAAEDSLPTLQAWSKAARSKWSSARRVIIARAEHHQQFYAGGDSGHVSYVASVLQEQRRMETFLRALEQRAYAVTLERSAASWALELAKAAVMVCDDVPSKAVDPSTEPAKSRRISSRSTAKRPPKQVNVKSRRSPQLPTESGAPRPTTETLCGRDADFFASFASPPAPRYEPRDLLRQLRGYFVPPPDLPDTVTPSRWKTFIETVFRLVILRVPALATLALTPVHALPGEDATVRPCGCATNPTLCSDQLMSTQTPSSSVHEFLDVLERQLGMQLQETQAEAAPVVVLWRALKYAKNTTSADQDSGIIDVGLLTNAIDAMLLDAEGTTDGCASSMNLLGGRVWKNSRCRSMPWTRAEWDLFYQLVGCPGCSLIATRDFASWTTNRRLALLGRYCDWASDTTDAERIFRLSDVVLCTSNSCHAGRKVRRVEQRCVDCGKKGKHVKKVVYIEEWEASWMYIKLPVDQCRSRKILDHLASLPGRYHVLARDAAKDATLHDPRSSRPVGPCTDKRSSCGGHEMPLARVRSGLSPVERKAAKWTTTSVLPTDTILKSLSNSSSPETRFHHDPYRDVIEAIVLDASPYSSPSHESWLAFATGVAQELLVVQGYTCFEAMFADALASAAACGDVCPVESELESPSPGKNALFPTESTSSLQSAETTRPRPRPNAAEPPRREPSARNMFRED